MSQKLVSRRTDTAIAIAIVVLEVLVGIAILHYHPYFGIYNGLNKGIVVGNCGLEVWGHPGFFCGDY